MDGGDLTRDERHLVGRIVLCPTDNRVYLGRDLKTGDVYIDHRSQKSEEGSA